jgi:hypothetical protein
VQFDAEVEAEEDAIELAHIENKWLAESLIDLEVEQIGSGPRS